jgi:hypothetical protein
VLVASIMALDRSLKGCSLMLSHRVPKMSPMLPPQVGDQWRWSSSLSCANAHGFTRPIPDTETRPASEKGTPPPPPPAPRHYPGAAPCVLRYTAYRDWLAAMNRRLRLGPPKQTLPQTSGRRMRPMSWPSGVQTVTPL